MTIDEVLDKLEDVRPSGNGYKALCPAHEDSNPSLGITEGENEILLQCYAGCATETVVEKMGIEMSDLFFGERERKPGGSNWGEPESVYSYVDEYGTTLFQAVRFPGKNFRQRHLKEGGTWEDGPYVWNIRDVRRVLYYLPEVVAARSNGQTVFVAEGEKDVEALRACGVVATCNPMGAGKWRPEYAQQLAGCRVVIVADRDEAGRRHAEQIKASLVGLTDKIWLVQAKSGKDASDHIAAGHTPSDFVPRKERARKGIVTAHELVEAARERKTMQPADMPGYFFTSLLPVEFRPGRVYSVGAYTGDGKSSLGLQGHRSLSEHGVRCGYFTLEMPEQDLVNRLVAHKGVPLWITEHPWEFGKHPDLANLYDLALREIDDWDSEIIFEAGMTADKIIETTRDREYDIIIVDHLHRFSWGGERRALEQQVQALTNLALDFNICVVLLCQLRRQTRGKDMEVFPEPTIADFRETAVIEQESSMCLSLWRQRIDNIRYAPGGTTKVTILKNRHTQGAHDAAGTSWYPVFNVKRQCFTSDAGGADAPAPNEPTQAPERSEWDG